MSTAKSTVNRQERRVKRERQADQEAEAIVAAAIENVKTEGKKRGEASAAEIEQGHEVKRLRDEGMAWWAIAHALGLPGSADNVKAGKSGASKARRLYAAAFGSLPATPRSLAKSRPDPFGNGAKPVGTRTRRDVIRKDESLESMFSEEHTDAELLEMLRGKKITCKNGIGGHTVELRVHRTARARIVWSRQGSFQWHPPMALGDRCIEFRDASSEDDRNCDPKYKGMPGGVFTIRLSDIVRIAQ